MAGYYDIAQICLNGHVINASTRTFPQSNSQFCGKCGSATIMRCSNCKSDIRGDYESSDVIDLTPSRYRAPAFCLQCGNPHPWTVASLQAAKDLAQDVEGLTSAERDVLTKSLDELVQDTPQAQGAALRFKRLGKKIGVEAAGAFKEILIGVVSETVKKSIWGS